MRSLLGRFAMRKPPTAAVGSLNLNPLHTTTIRRPGLKRFSPTASLVLGAAAGSAFIVSRGFNESAAANNKQQRSTNKPSPPAHDTRPPASSAAPEAATLRVAVVGSSVALGPRGNPPVGGWAQHLESALVVRYHPHQTCGGIALPHGCSLVNFAQSGATTTETLAQIASDRYRSYNPHVTVIGLSLGNEGLTQAQTTEAVQSVTDSFVRGTKQMISALTAARPATAPPPTATSTRPLPPLQHFVIFGGVYPNDQYTTEQYAALVRINQDMNSWPGVHAVFSEFLSATDDGNGHWSVGLRGGDAAHPNLDGHKAMFDTIDVGEVFDPIAARLLLIESERERERSARK